MKRCLLLAIAAFTVLTSYCQAKIEGVYKFKPGITTIDIIKELEKELKEKVETVSDPTRFYMKTGYKVKLYSTKMEYKDAFINIINVNTLPKAKNFSYSFINNSPYEATHQVY